MNLYFLSWGLKLEFLSIDLNLPMEMTKEHLEISNSLIWLIGIQGKSFSPV
jgi:hypothetical protein